MDIVKHTYPKDMDPEMVEICDCLNSMPGVRTTFCCFGHGDPIGFYIAMCISNMLSMKKILKVFSNKYENCDKLGLFEDDGFDLCPSAIGAEGNPAKDNEIGLRIGFKSWHTSALPITKMTKTMLKKIVRELKKD